MKRIVFVGAKVVISVVALFMLSNLVFAQSSSASSPTPLTTAFSGKGTGQETIYYFSAIRGPGEVVVSLKLSAKQYSTFGRVEVSNASGGLLATLNMDASNSTGIAQQSRSFVLAKKETIKLKLIIDANLGEYTLSFGGGTIGPATSQGRAASSSQRPVAVTQNTPTNSNRPSPMTQGNRPGRVGLQTAEQTSINVRCPNSVNVGVREVPAGWSDPAPRNISVTGISASGPFVTCEYKDAYYNASLVQIAPETFECIVPNLGPKQAECRRKIIIQTNE